jgi:hypothetical protein
MIFKKKVTENVWLGLLYNVYLKHLPFKEGLRIYYHKCA